MLVASIERRAYANWVRRNKREFERNGGERSLRLVEDKNIHDLQYLNGQRQIQDTYRNKLE